MSNNIFFGIFLALFFISCHKKNTPTLLLKEGFPNEYLDARAKVAYRSEEKDANFVVKIRHQQEKRTWALFTKIGIEGLRVLLQPDSVFIINTNEGEFQKSSFDTLTQVLNFPIEFSMVQRLIMGDMPNEDTTNTRREGDFIKVSQQLKHILAENKLHPTTQKLAELYLVDSRNQNRMTIQYSDYRPSPQKLFPYKININIDFINKRNQKREKTTLELDFSKAIFSSMPVEFPFIVPKSYLKKGRK